MKWESLNDFKCWEVVLFETMQLFFETIDICMYSRGTNTVYSAGWVLFLLKPGDIIFIILLLTN